MVLWRVYIFNHIKIQKLLSERKPADGKTRYGISTRGLFFI